MRKAWILAMVSVLAGILTAPGFAAADGAAVYGERCSGCHKAAGTGVPGIFPPLAGHAAKVGGASRAYLIQAVLFGLKGEIRVAGKTYDGTMPAYAGLMNDGEIAAVLDYILSSWGNDKALPEGHAKVTAADVEVQRAAAMTSDQVYAARAKLKLDCG